MTEIRVPVVGPHGQISSATAQSVCSEGQRLFWPSASYDFSSIPSKLFRNGLSPGSVVLRTATRQPPDLSKIDTRGAGPYGPVGELWIVTSLWQRCTTISISAEEIQPLAQLLVPLLTIELLIIDTGVDKRTAHRYLQEGAAYGRLVFPLTPLHLIDYGRVYFNPSEALSATVSGVEHLADVAQVVAERDAAVAKNKSAQRVLNDYQELQKRARALSDQLFWARHFQQEAEKHLRKRDEELAAARLTIQFERDIYQARVKSIEARVVFSSSSESSTTSYTSSSASSTASSIRSDTHFPSSNNESPSGEAANAPATATDEVICAGVPVPDLEDDLRVAQTEARPADNVCEAASTQPADEAMRADEVEAPADEAMRMDEAAAPAAAASADEARRTDEAAAPAAAAPATAAPATAAPAAAAPADEAMRMDEAVAPAAAAPADAAMRMDEAAAPAAAAPAAAAPAAAAPAATAPAAAAPAAAAPAAAAPAAAAPAAAAPADEAMDTDDEVDAALPPCLPIAAAQPANREPNCGVGANTIFLSSTTSADGSGRGEDDANNAKERAAAPVGPQPVAHGQKLRPFAKGHYEPEDGRFTPNDAGDADHGQPPQLNIDEALDVANTFMAHWRGRAHLLERKLQSITRLQDDVEDPLFAAPASADGQAGGHPPSPNQTGIIRPVPLDGPANIDPKVFGLGTQVFRSSELFSWMRGPGRYVDFEDLAFGRQARILRAKDILRPGRVAIKAVATTPRLSVPRWALKEVGALSKVNHANVVQLRDVVMHHLAGQPTLQIVMEYAYTDLEQVLRHPPSRARLAPRVVWGIARQLGDGLRAVHAQNIAHFDLKPANILLHADGRVLVADFGFAEDVTQPAPALRERPVVTLPYRAPEVLLRSRDIGCAVDVWAYGVVLAALIDPEGFPPWNSSRPDHILAMQVADIGPQDEELWPGSDRLPGVLVNDEHPYHAPVHGPTRPLPMAPKHGAPTPLARRLRQTVHFHFSGIIRLIGNILVTDPARRPTMHTILTNPVYGLYRRVEEPLPTFIEKHTTY
ncbi:Cyclin-dependent kinase 2 [Tilletia horrida]|nr:Cyclin-dependent kinase 2 [Tilletia horrida]